MAIPKITGAQRDFSAGELDESMKRADENPIMKTGCRQLSNFRITSGGQATQRGGRRALFPEAGRVEEVLMSPGNTFFLVFGNGYLRVYNAAGTQVFNSTKKGDGSTAIPWTTATAGKVSFVVAAGVLLQIFIAYADGSPANVPQVLAWDGVSQSSAWTLSTFAETVTLGGQKRTIFNRISPQGITLVPSATTGTVTLTASAPGFFVAGMVGTRIAYCGRQILITAVASLTSATGTAEEMLPQSQALTMNSDPTVSFDVGDEVKGSVSGAVAIVVATQASPALLTVQLIPTATGGIVGFTGQTSAGAEEVAGPNGSGFINGSPGVSNGSPAAVAIWDDEVMNLYRGYPSSVFFDQSRLGFCNFPAQPSAIGWSAIGLSFDFYIIGIGENITPASAIYELAPDKVQVLYVVGGMEGSEFVFCDKALYYIPISQQVPLAPGSVAFNRLSQQGCFPVQPQLCEQSVLYIKAGGTQIGAVQVPGAYYRPYVVDDVSQFHGHLLTASAPICIAIQKAPNQSEETYVYIVRADGVVIQGKYSFRQGLLDVGPEGKPKIGWLRWQGMGSVAWISAQAGDVIFTTAYFTTMQPGANWPSGVYPPQTGTPVHLVEILDQSQLVDAAVLVNSLPAPFAPPGGKGPLYFYAGGFVTLCDGARPMGVYAIDVNGNIVPQFNGGENLTSATLTAGQPWVGIIEPFIPDAQPGQSVHQRMFKRRVSRMAAYVSNSTGFLMARLFSGPITPTSPPLGTVMNNYRVTTWNQGDDPTQPPPLREEAYRWRPRGRSFDPRDAIIKDTPGSIICHEIGFEATI